MQDLIDRALDAAQRAGANYADVRLVERDSESVTIKNGALEAAEARVWHPSLGRRGVGILEQCPDGAR
jgi:hypothetical protein